KSRHPDIQVITGGSLFLVGPPRGGDAWRMGDWTYSYQMAWYERWNELMRDLDEFGQIKFLEQSFDSFPVDSTYHAGGYGFQTYVPALRASPGVWYRLGPARRPPPTGPSKN